MNRNYIASFALTLLVSAYAWGQNSDVIRYYIAYDVSGSVGSIDQNDNLQNSLYRLLNVDQSHVDQKNSHYQQAISFDLFPFGETTESLAYNAFDRKVVPLQTLKTITERGRQQMYSDLANALRQIDENLDGKSPSVGVFIFTDGSFDASDIKPSDNGTKSDAAFRTEQLKIDSLLLEIKKKVGQDKVFIVQTSQGHPNFNFSADKERLPQVAVDSVAISPNYFWIDARQSVNATKYTPYLDNFIQQANATISTHPYLSLQTEQEVVITLQEIFSVLKTDDDLRNSIKTETNDSSENAFDTICKLLADEKPTLTAREIGKIRNALDALTQAPNTPSRYSLFLNEIKREIYEAGYTKQIEEIATQIQGDKGSSSVEQKRTPEPLKLTEAYHRAPPTAVREIATQAKAWENFEQNLLLGMADYMVNRAKMEVTYAFIDNVEKYVFSDDGNPHVALVFPSTHDFVKQRDKTYDILALRDVVKKDIVALPTNMLRYPHLVDNEHLYSFWVYMQLYNRLMRHGSLEQSFTELHRMFNDTPPGDDQSVVNRIKRDPTGKAMILSINLIHYLNQNNFAESYNRHHAEQELREMSILLFALAVDTEHVEKVTDLNAVVQEINNVYLNYRLAISQLKSLKELLAGAPTADFDGYRRYQKDMLLDILKRIASILTSGGEIIRHLELKKTQPDAVEEQLSLMNHAICALYRAETNTAWESLKYDASQFKNSESRRIQSFVRRIKSTERRKAVTTERLIGYLEKKRDKAKTNEQESAHFEALLDTINRIKTGESSPTIESLLAHFPKNTQKAIRDEKNPEKRRELMKNAVENKKKELEFFENKQHQTLINALHFGMEAWFNIKEENYAQAMFNVAEGLFPDEQKNSRVLTSLLLASGEIASAKSADDIGNAIARHTLPVASHRIKKENPRTFMVGSYVGLTGTYFQNRNEVRRYWGGPTIIAAIGPEVTTLFGKKQRSSVSVMVPLLDLGNIIQYRYSAGDGNVNDVSFARVFSPGLVVAVSPFKLPIAITGSWMVNPARYQVGASLDMPLLGIWKKSN